ncbi:MAG: DUF4192 family protein [Micromonosporaceae bacterium]|nr:DUF4192 family protein [Micromonosporaceae bacterium]
MTAPPVTDPRPDSPLVTLRSPADLIAFTPYLLGFHPTDSVVVVGFRDREVAFAARGDLPDPGGGLPDPGGGGGPVTGGGPVIGPAREIADLVVRQPVDAVALLGYGPAAAVDPLLGAVHDMMRRRDLRVTEVLRVTDGRWWSYLCDNPRCCPPEGVPIDPVGTGQVTAWCTYAGLTAAGSRQELAGRIAPVGGAERAAMTRATDRAERELLGWLETVPEAGRAEAVLGAGRSALDAARTRYAEGGALADGELARLGLLLASIPVRDAAWRAVTTEQSQLRLWTDLTRRADPPLVPAPASLLAFTAWRSGDGALAGLAVQRALQEDPCYSMATLILDALQQGLAPSTLDGWPEVGEPGDEIT